MSDRILGGLALVFAAFYIWQATLIRESFMSDVVGPKTFPLILGVAMGVCALVILLRPDSDPVWPKGMQLLEVLMAVAVMFAYAQLLPDLGFLIATALASTYLTWRLGTGPVMAVIAGIATSGGIYIVFRLILGLSLAKGPLGF
ncbi:tripartite tricarboxylate transporter TctB family protein [Frigidibacter sp. ROC022]|uniref:tripartite tricarboxylate transporter TctB family protein n=1 Tax=Frigidibacter sp. ROC022 TaxID=2971796 RepID=UPI00215AC865|nr:tripartite tricarboxylate transporter TctB family protein [Frigidibacter sp. ROC022]MCR8724094.1 tripartite tricarboxylate transporter TctB family protein [Frigidibacter sp. ROC022]